MLKGLLNGIACLLLFSISAFFLVIVAYLVSSEVLPAVQQGGLSVESSTMILNHVWEGNEIYILLAAYVLVACVSAYGAIRFGMRAFRR